MARDILIASILIAIGALCGYGYSEWSRPTREEIIADLADDIADDHDSLVTEIHQGPEGPVLYVVKGSGRQKGDGVARVEVSHEGRYMVSPWNRKTQFYDYHFGKTMSDSELSEIIDKAGAKDGE